MPSLPPVRVRFAPSPTGHLHIGGARTALYNYLLAKQTGGTFIIRIEDTDQTRFVPGAMEEQMNSLRWLGIHWDEGPGVGGPHGPYIQSQRADIHRAHAEQLVEMGAAYYCFCTKERLETVRAGQIARKEQSRYDSHCRHIPLAEAKARKQSGESCVIRFKVDPEGTTTVHDHIRGDITIANSTLDDFVILKSDGLSLYHLAAMVDDHLMGITHVIRSSEWIPSLPKHALIHRAFGWQEPDWVHLSVFLKPSGKGKLSKRDVVEGHAILVHEMPVLGFIPEALNNWIALMGWSLDDKTDFLSLDQMIAGFSLDRLNPSPAAINFDKLDYFNGLHIRTLEPSDLAHRLLPFFTDQGFAVTESDLFRVIPLIQPRIAGLDEALTMIGFFFRSAITYDRAALIPKGMEAASALAALQRSTILLRAQPDFNHRTTEPPLRQLAQDLNLKPGQLFGILRVAVTGQTVSPPLFETMELMDREVVSNRLAQAEKILSNA